jgi:glycosyltransferase involved in cell wall biosynthesis
MVLIVAARLSPPEWDTYTTIIIKDKAKKFMKIAVIGNYPPKACGIATFTENLVSALHYNVIKSRKSIEISLIAIDDTGDQLNYPSEVVRVIQKEDPASYLATAQYINQHQFDCVLVQHEFGIFGGKDGSYIISLIRRLNAPVVFTLHTVLKQPSPDQKRITQSIAKYAQKIIVMSHLACRFLSNIYNISDEQLVCIQHGIPDIQTEERAVLRQKLEVQDKTMLLTFGLLSRGKGVDTVVRALPALVEKHPDIVYVILGKTHPNVVKEEGESYRDSLKEMAAELGVRDHLRFVDEFADEQKLFEYIRACDVYVIPYLNEAQITSGTLAYAVGAGAAIVSTPFWHATELLDEGRGKLFPFADHHALSNILLELLDDEPLRETLRERTYTYGLDTKWNVVGKEYLDVLLHQTVLRKHLQAEKKIAIPALNLNHLHRLTDDTGIIQHAKFAIPNRFEGYCLDDNARAYLLAAMVLQEREDAELLQAAETYVSYIFHAQHPDGLFRNFMSFERNFLEHIGSEDAFGRAFWAIGYGIAHPPADHHLDMLCELFNRSHLKVSQLQSPRAIAYCVAALSYFLERYPNDGSIQQLLQEQTLRLCHSYEQHRMDKWEWFEPYMTYCNGIMPYALFRAVDFVDSDQRTYLLRVAEATADFLQQHTFRYGYLSPIGCHQPFTINTIGTQEFDQQPVDAMNSVLLYAEAYRVTQDQQYKEAAIKSFHWFLGNNELEISLYDAQTNGCYDGLTANGANGNQGAESLIAYLLAHQVSSTMLTNQKKSSKKHTNGIELTPNKKNFIDTASMFQN